MLYAVSNVITIVHTCYYQISVFSFVPTRTALINSINTTQFQLVIRYINILLNSPSKHGSLAQQNIDVGFSTSNFPWKATVAILSILSYLRTLTLDCRNTRGYTIGGHARDRSRDWRLRSVHSLHVSTNNTISLHLPSTVLAFTRYHCWSDI